MTTNFGVVIEEKERNSGEIATYTETMMVVLSCSQSSLDPRKTYQLSTPPTTVKYTNKNIIKTCKYARPLVSFELVVISMLNGILIKKVFASLRL